MDSSQKNINFIYPETKQEDLQFFRKRLSIQQFKQIDQQRIELQFKILEEAKLKKKKYLLYLQQNNKNRYADIVPYQFNRVLCGQVKDFYINASFMKSVTDNRIFAIFGQAPLKACMKDFWYGCYHFNVKKIVMLCTLLGQAERYWPLQKQQIILQEMNLNIRCKQRKQITTDCVETVFTLIGSDGQKEIQHLHWMGWNDMNKPKGEKSEEMFQKIVQHCVSVIDNQQLLFVHCSAGVGRTGTLGAVIESIRCAKMHKTLSIFEIVQNLRQNRLYSVETFAQYKFIYDHVSKMI